MPVGTHGSRGEGDERHARLTFEVGIEWSGGGRDGAGTIHADDRTLDWSAPVSMGGRGEGASAGHVAAAGAVTGYPADPRLERVTVSPTISGADPRRGFEYDRAARIAHDRCLVGRAIAGNVAYDVGRVAVGTTRFGPASALAK